MVRGVPGLKRCFSTMLRDFRCGVALGTCALREEAFTALERVDRPEAREVGGVSEFCTGETDRTDDAVSIDDTDSGRLGVLEVEGPGWEGCLFDSNTVFISLALCSFMACLRTSAELTWEYPHGHRISCVARSLLMVICFAMRYKAHKRR